MKRVAALCLVGLGSALALSGCAIHAPPDPLKEETLASGMDAICAEYDQVVESFGTKGEDPAGIAIEHRDTARALRELADDLGEPEVTRDVEPKMEFFIEATLRLADAEEAYAEAASGRDRVALADARSAVDEASGVQRRVAREIGTGICGREIEGRVEPTGTGPAGDVEFTEPRNTIDQAARSVSRRSEGAKVVGTEQYGPVGQAEIVGPDGIHRPTYFVEGPDARFRTGGQAVHEYGGLRPAPAGNDADAIADRIVTAIREGDSVAFNETLADPRGDLRTRGEGFRQLGTDRGSRGLIRDLRTTGVVAQPLGRNVSFAFYQVPGKQRNYVLTLVHRPGGANQYRLEAVHPVPMPAARR